MCNVNSSLDPITFHDIPIPDEGNSMGIKHSGYVIQDIFLKLKI